MSKSRDLVVEARRVIGEASRIHTRNDNDASKDEDVSWLIEALADEVERLREIDVLLEMDGMRDCDKCDLCEDHC
jgi:hypothetical protein